MDWAIIKVYKYVGCSNLKQWEYVVIEFEL